MRRFFGLIACALVAGACIGAHGAPPPPTPAPTATPLSDAAFRAFAQPAADKAVLTLADMPSGWIARPIDNSQGYLSLTPQCSEINDINGNVDYKGSIAEAQSQQFSAGADEAERVASDVGVYRDESAAQAQYQHFVDLIRMCRTELSSAYEFEARISGADYAYAKVDEVPVKHVGDAATAFVIKMEFGKGTQVVDVEWHIVVMRFVRTVGSVSYALTPNFVQTDADAVTKIVADRLSAANDTLPEPPPGSTTPTAGA